MFQAVGLPAGTADLAASLANVDGDALTGCAAADTGNGEARGPGCYPGQAQSQGK